jgi:hypothetical protein
VGQDVWNPIPGWAQTLHAIGPGDWHATANMPAENTAVVSFPNVGQQYDENKLAGFSSIYSSFTEDMHATSATSAWAAYDIWLNNWGNEVMIQHDFANNGPCTAMATATFGGSGGVPVQSRHLCTFGSELAWKLTGGNEQSGSVDILAMLTWLQHHGYLPQNSGLTDISYCFEICSTGGQPETSQSAGFRSAPQIDHGEARPTAGIGPDPSRLRLMDPVRQGSRRSCPRQRAPRRSVSLRRAGSAHRQRGSALPLTVRCHDGNGAVGPSAEVIRWQARIEGHQRQQKIRRGAGSDQRARGGIGMAPAPGSWQGTGWCDIITIRHRHNQVRVVHVHRLDTRLVHPQQARCQVIGAQVSHDHLSPSCA